MVDTPNRRRFLQLTGASATAAVAGCADLNPMSDGDGPHADKVTAIVEPNREAMQEIEEDVMAGEMDQMEAEQELETLVDDAITSFEDREADDDELIVEESESLTDQTGQMEMGMLYLLDGEPASLIDALMNGTVSQLHGGATYETILEQQQAAEEQQSPGSEQPDEEELEEIEEELEGELEEQEETEDDADEDSDE